MDLNIGYSLILPDKLFHSLFSVRNNRRITASLLLQFLFLAMCHVLAYGSLKHSAGKLCSTDNPVSYTHLAKVEDCPGFETFGADVKAAREAKRLARKTLAEMVAIERCV